MRLADILFKQYNSNSIGVITIIEYFSNANEKIINIIIERYGFDLISCFVHFMD